MVRVISGAHCAQMSDQRAAGARGMRLGCAPSSVMLGACGVSLIGVACYWQARRAGRRARHAAGLRDDSSAS